jgi:uncharacterized membrane protein
LVVSSKLLGSISLRGENNVTAKADWIVVAGFVLAVLGVVLRILIMMRASDARSANATATGRELLHSYGAAFPKSRLPLAMWISLSLGLVLLIAGLLLEMR